jgi:hypothetical protein
MPRKAGCDDDPAAGWKRICLGTLNQLRLCSTVCRSGGHRGAGTDAGRRFRRKSDKQGFAFAGQDAKVACGTKEALFFWPESLNQ